MHDLDRTQNLFESEYDGLETYDYEGEGEEEIQDESYLFDSESESAFDEMEEMELAADFLEVSDEAELEEFLGKLIRKAKKAAGGFLKTGLGKQIGGLLKGAAKQALPALGNVFLPGVGGVAGAKLGQLFGLELEGLSPQDQEFEGARKFVRFAGEVAQAAANAPPNMPAQQGAKPPSYRPRRSTRRGCSVRRTGGVRATGFRAARTRERAAVVTRAGARRRAAGAGFDAATASSCSESEPCRTTLYLRGRSTARRALCSRGWRASSLWGCLSRCCPPRPSRPPRKQPSSAIWPTGGASCAGASGGSSFGCGRPRVARPRPPTRKEGSRCSA